MAQTLGTAIEQLAAVGTPPPVAASFPSKSAADSAAQQARAPAPVAPKANASAVEAAATAASAGSPPSAAIQAVVEAINVSFMTSGKSLELSVDAESNRSIVILRDTMTGAVIGQFPTEQVLRLQSLLGTDPHVLIDRTA